MNLLQDTHRTPIKIVEEHLLDDTYIRNGRPIKKIPFIDGRYYEGPIDPATQTASGFGVLISKTNEVYIGRFKDGQPNGLGLLIGSGIKSEEHMSLSYYHGLFKEGRLDGKIVLIHSDHYYSNVYSTGKTIESTRLDFPKIEETKTFQLPSGPGISEKDFKTKYRADRLVGPTTSFHGTFDPATSLAATKLGVLINTNPEASAIFRLFVGEFQEGLLTDKNGIRVDGSPDGETVYIGSIVAFSRHGRGLVFSQGNGYRFGPFANDDWTNEGVQVIMTEQETYQGPLNQKSEPHGLGKLTSNGKIYEGPFENGKKNGRGTLYLSSGQVKEVRGLWKQGQFPASGTLLYRDGSHYTGTIKGSKEQAEGLLIYPSPPDLPPNAYHLVSYQGQLKNGLYEGEGTLSYSNGMEFKGTFKKGKQHGIGVCQFTTDFTLHGRWDNGILVFGSDQELAAPPPTVPIRKKEKILRSTTEEKRKHLKKTSHVGVIEREKSDGGFNEKSEARSDLSDEALPN